MIKNQYQELRDKQQKEVNDFPFMFAFNKEQLEKEMERVGLHPADTDKIASIGSGGFIKKDDAPAMRDMFDRHAKEFEDAIASDTTGDGFIYDMFRYELANHEYCITYDLEDTLDALGLTYERVNADNRLLKGLNMAKTDYLESEV